MQTTDAARPLLAVESSTATGSVAVGGADGVAAEMTLEVGGSHSSALLPAIDHVVRAAGLVPRDLGGVVVGAGPGSFTGVRIAAATAKGIVAALDVPLLAYSSLLAAAASAWAARRVWVLFDARRRDTYAACYDFAGDGGAAIAERIAPAAVSLDELIGRVRGERHAGDESPVFVGDAATRHAAELERELGARVLPPHLGVPRASALLWLAARAPERGHVSYPAGWEPEYLRAPGAERIAAARAGSPGNG